MYCGVIIDLRSTQEKKKSKFQASHGRRACDVRPLPLTRKFGIIIIVIF
jgi:hypothetical protein